MDEVYTEGRLGTSDLLLSFLLGGLAGAALALFYAPRSGPETREKLREGISRRVRRSRELRDQVVERGRGMVEDATQYVERGRDRISAALDAGREAYRQEKRAVAPPPSPGSPGAH